MKNLLIGLVALAALGLGVVFAAPPASMSFSAEPVHVGDTYTVSASDLRPNETISFSALYGSSWISCHTASNAAGEASCAFTAIDLGSDSKGGRFGFGQGAWFVAEPGEVIHLVWQLKKQGCGAQGCYDLVADDTLTVLP